MKGLNKALFLDLEGTLIRVKSGDKFSRDINDWEFIEGILPSIKRFADRGYLICVVSNQGGIELAKVTEQFIDDKCNLIRKEIEDYIRTDVTMVYCKEMESYDRKPNPGMAYFLARHYSLNLRQSIMVGDNEVDNEFSINAGIGAFLKVDMFREYNPQ